MKRIALLIGLLCFIASPVNVWAAAMSDDITRDATAGDPFELVLSINGIGFDATDTIGTQEIFYAVRGADGRYYYTFRDLCADQVAQCNAAGTGQDMRRLGAIECQMGFQVYHPNPGPGVDLCTLQNTWIAYGPATGTAQADFGGEFFAATSIVAEVGGPFGLTTFGPGLNGDPVMSQVANNGMGDANNDGWPGGAGETPWVPIPTGATGASVPSLTYATAPFQHELSQAASLLAFFSDPLRTTQIISNFDIMIDVLGNDGRVYRTAYNLNAVMFPTSAIPTPPLPALNPGTGAAMVYIDRQFPVDTGAGVVTGDGWPRIATRLNPNNGLTVIGSFAEESPWVRVAQ